MVYKIKSNVTIKNRQNIIDNEIIEELYKLYWTDKAEDKQHRFASLMGINHCHKSLSLLRESWW